MPEKKSENRMQSALSNASLEEIFKKFVQFRYTGLIIAALYFTVMLTLSLSYHKIGDYGVETDFFWSYVPKAKSFLNGYLQIDSFRGPLYPIALGLVNLAVKDFFISGIIIGVVSASFSIFLTFEFIKRIFSSETAFIVSLLLAFNPVFIQYTYSAGTDMMFNVLAAATLFFFFKDKEFNYQSIIIAAMLGGLSYLTRYNGVFLLGFVFVILLVNYWDNNWIQRLKSSAVFIAVFFLTFAPWGIYCLSKKGNFFFNENYKNIAYELYGKGKIPWDKFWFDESGSFSSVFDVIGRDPVKFIATIIGNIGGHFLYDMQRLMGWYIGVFIVFGLMLLVVSNPFKNWKKRETGYYLSNLFFFALLTLIFYSERFSIFLIPFYGLIAIQPFFREKFALVKYIPSNTGYFIASLLITITLAKSISFNSSRINSGPKEILIVKDLYNEKIPESEKGHIIAARKPHIAYYLEMYFILLPMADSYDEFIEKLHNKNVDYLYFSPIEAAMRRELELLLNPNSNHPGLEVVIFLDKPSAVLYKVLP